MKFTTGTIEALYMNLKNVQLSKLDDADKYKMVKNLFALKAVVDGLEEFKREYAQKVQPDGWAEIAPQWEKIRAEGKEGCGLAADVVEMAEKVAAEYNEAVIRGIIKELNVVHDIELKRISEKSYEAILCSGEMDMEMAMLIGKCMVDLKEETTEAVEETKE